MNYHSFEICRRISFLHTHEMYISDILHFMRIDTAYIYGAGEMGKLLMSDLCGEIDIPAVFDQSVKENKFFSIERTRRKHKTLCFSYPLLHPDQIPDDDVSIIITPVDYYSDIIDTLLGKGIKKSRLLTFNVLLYYGVFYCNKLLEENTDYRFPNQEFLITGAQFVNKGAQAMAYTAISEIRSRFGDSVIWLCPNFGGDEYRRISEEYEILFLVDGMERNSTLYEIMPRLNGIIDVSGYALSSNSSVNNTKRVLNFLSLARDFNTPIYLMPQSFGPFDYGDSQNFDIGKMLSYAQVIFAREKAGYNLLVNTYQLTNVKYSKDLVLQNKNINPEYIYTNKKEKKIIQIEKNNNVAVIPNIQNYKNGNPKTVLGFYIDIIYKLLSYGKKVYIIPHSNDEIICNDIYEIYKKNENVYLFEDEFDCLEFGEILNGFQYVIGSRYHAIVCAYKNHIPCIVIGWAEKYRELLECFGQEQFLFDVRDQISTERISAAVELMEKTYEREAEKIAEILLEVQKDNCFDALEATENLICEDKREYV